MHDLEPNIAIDKADEYLSAVGARFTPLRRRVLELIWQQQKPSKAYDLLDQLEGSEGKPPTVYRTLDFLQSHGLIHRLDSLNAYIGCHHPNQHENCYFLICDQCESVTECCQDEHINTTKALHQVELRYDFTASHTTLEIHGICRNCKDTLPT